MLNIQRITTGPLSTLVFGLLLFSSQATKANNIELEALAAAEDIAVLSQSIVKNYFYIGENLNTSTSERMLSEEINTIDASLKILADSSDYSAIQGDIDFIEMIWSDLKTTLVEPYSKDNGLLIIDMGEVILEGSDNLTSALYQSGVQDGDEIDTIEVQRFLIERMAKLYILSISGLKDFNAEKQMSTAVADFNEGLTKMESRSYPDNIRVKVEKLRKRWDSSSSYYLDVKEGDLPKTVFFNTEMIERYLKSIFEYYKK